MKRAYWYYADSKGELTVSEIKTIKGQKYALTIRENASRIFKSPLRRTGAPLRKRWRSSPRTIFRRRMRMYLCTTSAIRPRKGQ